MSALKSTFPCKSPPNSILESAAQDVAVEALPTISAAISMEFVFQRLLPPSKVNSAMLAAPVPSMIIPPPSAAAAFGAPVPRTKLRSSICTLVELMVVVVPST